MALTVHVVDKDSSTPLSGERVKIVIHHGGIYPDTSLEEYTDDGGTASFPDFDASSVDSYVGGSQCLDGVGVDDDVTVYV